MIIYFESRNDFAKFEKKMRKVFLIDHFVIQRNISLNGTTMNIILEHGFTIFSLVWFVVFGYVFFSFIFKMLLPLAVKGALYVPSKDNEIRAMVALAGVKAGEKAVDLGAGNGRIVMALARQGAEAHGYEINPFLVRSSKKNIKDAGLEGKAFIHLGNFWSVNFSEFDVVTVFGISHMMKRLEAKLKKELKPGARVVSNHFVFPNWPHAKKENGVRLYIK